MDADTWHIGLVLAGTEKFIFDSESVCIVYFMGEMTIVAYGRNEVLGVCRTEHVHPTLLSVVAHQVGQPHNSDLTDCLKPQHPTSSASGCMALLYVCCWPQ
jgi:hypothetical protein